MGHIGLNYLVLNKRRKKSNNGDCEIITRHALKLSCLVENKKQKERKKNIELKILQINKHFFDTLANWSDNKT